MFKEANILKLKLHKSTSFLLKFYNDNSEVLFTLYDLLLENPIEIFWYEFVHIFFGYSQLIAYLFDSTVSIQLIIEIYSLLQFGIKFQ